MLIALFAWMAGILGKAGQLPKCRNHQAWTHPAQLLPYLENLAVKMQCCLWNVVCGMLRCQVVAAVQESQARVAELEAQVAASAQHLAAKHAELAAKQMELVGSQQLVQVVHYLFRVPLPFAPMPLIDNNKSVPNSARKTSGSAYLHAGV